MPFWPPKRFPIRRQRPARRRITGGLSARAAQKEVVAPVAAATATSASARPSADEGSDGGEDDYFPKKKEWTAFCADFERAMNAIHARDALRLVLKPDEGPPKTGAWHQSSTNESYRLAELAVSEKRKPTNSLSGLFTNLLQDVLHEDGRGARRLAPGARRAWLSWVDC